MRRLELLRIVDVPQDWIECSVCGKFCAPESYRNEDQTQQSRTNCKTCCEMSMDEWPAIQDTVKQIKSSFTYYTQRKQCEFENDIQRYGVPVKQVIEYLASLPEDAILAHNNAEQDFTYFKIPGTLICEIDGIAYYDILV